MNPNDLPAEEFSYSHEAECSVLGAVLSAGPDAYDAANLTASMFFQPLHQVLWTELEALVLAGKHVDVVALMERMRGAEVNWSYVHALTSSYVSVRAAKGHAKIVRDYAKARALKAAARTVVDLAADESITIEQRVGQAVGALEAVVEERADRDVLPIGDFAADFIDRLQAMADGELTAARATNVPTLDRFLSGGLRDEQLVIVAARPSVGKSSFAQQLALSSARDGVPAAFFGMEMTSRELTNRTVANLGRVGLGGLKTGKLSSDEWTRVTDGVEALRDLPLYLYDQPAMTLAEVASKARRVVRKHGVKLIVVDYLQLMKGSSGRTERRVELEEITRGSKQLAKQLGITVVLLSQLNREVEKRSNPRPVMSDLKECGAIEEDADVILGLWTHRKGNEGEADIKGCVLLKNRDGQQGEFALHFDGPYQRWSESTESLQAPKAAMQPMGSKFGKEL
jgi:replicative DNA helicase